MSNSIKFKLRCLGAQMACLALAILSISLVPSATFAHQAGIADSEIKPVAEQVEDPSAADPFGRGTPRGSYIGFLRATEEFDYETAAQYLDLRNLPLPAKDMDGAVLAEQLNFVIERAFWVDVGMLSDNPKGLAADGLPSHRDELATVDTEDGSLTLLTQRVPGEEGYHVWKVSNATIGQVPELYDRYRYHPWTEQVRERFPGRGGFFGVETFKWVIMLIVGLVALPLMWLTLRGLAVLLSPGKSPLRNDIRKLLCRPVLGLIMVLLMGYTLIDLGVGATLQAAGEAKTITLIMIAWLLFGLIDLARAWRREYFISKGRTDAAVLGRPFANALKLLALLIIALTWLSNIGVNITTLLAGLGIGGVAVALALQKPIEDLFGAVTLYSQRSVTTGDFIRYAGQLGKVEEIGLRVTSIRTQGNTILAVPNSRLAYADVENISQRQRIWYQPLIRLRVDTSPEQIREIVAQTRNLLGTDDRVLKDILRVQFRNFGEYAIEIKVHTYIGTTDFGEYLEIAEELNMAILEIVHDQGASLALPNRGGRAV